MANHSDTRPDEQDALPLEPPPETAVEPVHDLRPVIPVPPPVRVIAVEDVTLLAPAHHAAAIDHLMTVILPLVKEMPLKQAHVDAGAIGVYLAENVRVVYLARDEPPPSPRHILQLELGDLRELRQRLQDAEIEYELSKRLMPGDVRVAFLDAAGNPIEVLENRAIL
jgi:hypothetical protein